MILNFFIIYIVFKYLLLRENMTNFIKKKSPMGKNAFFALNEVKN